ncbi:MAG: hypothetical protein RLY58_2152 [Pseudomonadota bacterium]
MTQIECLERDIAALDMQAFTTLRDWILELDQTRWDEQLADDSNAGKLDFLINTAVAEHHAGQSKPL